MPTTDDAARDAALEFTRALAAFWDDRLGARLLGVYLLGSLAHGGFNRRYSDIDMAVIAEDGLDEAVITTMRAQAAALAPDLAAKLSLFWADRGFSIGRFPPLDRVDYIDNGVALVERARARPKRPSRRQVQDYLRGAPFENWANASARFAALDALTAADHKPYLRALLYPVRFAYSWVTGEMASNDDAVEIVCAHPPAGLDVDLVSRALACRHAAADPDPLFASRGVLPRQVDACARLIPG